MNSDVPHVKPADLEEPGATAWIDDAAEQLERTPPDIKAEAQVMLEDPHLVSRILDDIESLGVVGERDTAMTAHLIATSRILDKPLAGMIQGPSSSGKSFIAEKVTQLMPPETVIDCKEMSPKALAYMLPWSLSHKFILNGERSRLENDDTADGTRLLREMLSSGYISKLVTTKGENGHETKLIFQPGPIAYIETTTLSNIFDEDFNRLIVMTTDEREEQTRRILMQTAAGSAASAGPRPDVARLIQVHHTAQRLLVIHRPTRIVIPYAERLALAFPAGRHEARRGFSHLMRMMETAALLHSFQRERTDAGELLATPDDYALARRLLAKPLERLLGGSVSDPAKRLYHRLLDLGPKFSTTDVAKRETVSEKTVRDWLGELHKAHWIEQAQPSRGPKAAVWRLGRPVPTRAAAYCPRSTSSRTKSASDHGQPAARPEVRSHLLPGSGNFRLPAPCGSGEWEVAAPPGRCGLTPPPARACPLSHPDRKKTMIDFDTIFAPRSVSDQGRGSSRVADAARSVAALLSTVADDEVRADLRYQYEERAATLEYDANLPRQEAEAGALDELLHRVGRG